MTQSEDQRLNIKATFFLMVLKMARKIGLTHEELSQMFSPNMLKRAYNHIDVVDAEARAGVRHTTPT